MPEIPSLGDDAARARLAMRRAEAASKANDLPGEPREQVDDSGTSEVIRARVAVVVFLTREGDTVLVPDTNVAVLTERPASRDEAYGMLAAAMKDINVMEAATLTAQATVQGIEERQRAAMKAMQDAQIKAALDRQGGIRR